MVPWEYVRQALKAALSDLRLQHSQLIASDTHIRTIGAHLGDLLQSHLDTRAATWNKYCSGLSAGLAADVYLNRNYDDAKKRSWLGGDTLGTLSRVQPALVIHNRTSPDFNVLAMEHRDETPESEYADIVHCKRRLLSYLNHPLNYEYAIFLRYDRAGIPTEAALLRRDALRQRSSTLSREMLQRFATVHKELKISACRQNVKKAKAEVAEIEQILGVESVIDGLSEE